MNKIPQGTQEVGVLPGHIVCVFGLLCSAVPHFAGGGLFFVEREPQVLPVVLIPTTIYIADVCEPAVFI